MKKDYREMVVAELRQISRERGLTLEYKGHKFNKPELIERLEAYDELYDKENNNKVEDKEVQNVNDDNTPWEEQEEVNDIVEVQQEVVEESKQESNYFFAETLDDIVKKYSGKRPEWVFEQVLAPGSFVVFIDYVESKVQPGNIYKKVRTAKVIGVNRSKKLVRVETLLGDVSERTFDELLYIKSAEAKYPKDISAYLRKQRTRKGWEIINEYKENHKIPERDSAEY